MGTTYQKRQAKAHFLDWAQSDLDSLDCCYNSYSGAKFRAWQYCKDLCYRLGGRGLRVITYNTNIFTCGFEYNDKTTDKLMFMYITPNYDCAIPFEEI